MEKEFRNCGNLKKLRTTLIDKLEFIDDPDGAKKLHNEMEHGGVAKHIWQLDNLFLYECPPKWIRAETNRLMDALFIFHRKDLPPMKGAWSDQPLWFIQAYSIFTEELLNRSKES